MQNSRISKKDLKQPQCAQEQLYQQLLQKLQTNNELLSLILMSELIKNQDIKKDDKSLLFLLLQHRDRNFIRINHNDEVYERIREYLRLVRPLDIAPQDLERIGGHTDGGYVSLRLAPPPPHCHAVSLGVSDFSPWDLAMAERGYKVVEYDASIEKSPYKHQNISFYKKFVGLNDDESTICLPSIIAQNALDPALPNILQMDIENAEWDILESIDISLLARFFSQVIFEFHGANPEEADGFAKRSAILRRLNKHFSSIHFHFNNHGKIFYSKDRFFSVTFEVSYLRNDLVPSYARGKLRSNGLIKGLDYPTDIATPDIPIVF